LKLSPCKTRSLLSNSDLDSKIETAHGNYQRFGSIFDAFTFMEFLAHKSPELPIYSTYLCQLFSGLQATDQI